MITKNELICGTKSELVEYFSTCILPRDAPTIIGHKYELSQKSIEKQLDNFNERLGVISYLECVKYNPPVEICEYELKVIFVFIRSWNINNNIPII